MGGLRPPSKALWPRGRGTQHVNGWLRSPSKVLWPRGRVNGWLRSPSKVLWPRGRCKVLWPRGRWPRGRWATAFIRGNSRYSWAKSQAHESCQPARMTVLAVCGRQSYGMSLPYRSQSINVARPRIECYAGAYKTRSISDPFVTHLPSQEKRGEWEFRNPVHFAVRPSPRTAVTASVMPFSL